MFRPIKNEDGSLVFVFDLSNISDNYINPVDYLNKQLSYIKFIEYKHPGEFNFRFNGRSIEIMSTIPCGSTEFVSVFGRYGGPTKFYKVLYLYFCNLISTNFKVSAQCPPVILSCYLETGIKLNEDDYNCTFISSNDDLKSVLEKAESPVFEKLNTLDMKFWIKYLNPDMIDYKKKPVIANPREARYGEYPPCIIEAMNMKNKPSKVRYLLMKFLLLIHKREDAKNILIGCLTDKETRKLEFGSLEERWTNAVNSLDNNMEPTCNQFKKLGLCKNCGKCCPFEFETTKEEIVAEIKEDRDKYYVGIHELYED